MASGLNNDCVTFHMKTARLYNLYQVNLLSIPNGILACKVASGVYWYRRTDEVKRHRL
jgi:hypothetical protein